jgi:hypothetical protein
MPLLLFSVNPFFLLEFPHFLEESIVLERKFAGSSGAPIEVSRKGQVFLNCEPDRVTAEAMKRRSIGFHLEDVNV